MLELLAAIQSVDPPSFVLWGLVAFAAGMYPIGIMLGSSCSACCLEPCAICLQGELPETVTVTFSGFADELPGDDLVTLSFTSCFGSGASGRVTAPGGDPATDKGPISAVEVSKGGSGYAVLGRVEPTLTISGGSGTGATFTPTLASYDDACGLPYWVLESVAVTGGTGYVDGESLTITASEGDTVNWEATAVVNTTRAEPTLSASVTGGTGATFSVTTSKNAGTPDTWAVSTVSVTDGGTGYADGAYVEITGSPDLVVVSQAWGSVRTGRSIPTVEAFTIGGGGGESLTPVLTKATGWDGRDYWTVSSITINSGGAGHAEYDAVTIGVTQGNEGPYSYFSAYISQVDANGAILAIQIDSGSEYWVDTGVIESVEMWYGGEYYEDDGVPTGVQVTALGIYYREDSDEPALVADVTVQINQLLPSDGTGAVLEAVIDDDPQSATFGQITSVTIVNGGDDYLAHGLFDNCTSRYDGRSFVLRRGSAGQLSGPCYYGYECDTDGCHVDEEVIGLEYRGPELPARLFIRKQSPGPDSVFYGTVSLEAVADWTNCSSFDLEFEVVSSSGAGYQPPPGASANVVPGGSYTTEPCASFQQSVLNGIKATIEWDGQTWEAAIGNPPADPQNRRCDESFATGGSNDFCGLVSIQYWISGRCGGFEYGSNTGFGLAVDGSAGTNPGCTYWGFSILLVKFTLNMFEVYSGGFSPFAPIPVDEDGYPSGTITLYSNAPSLPANARAATVTFSKVLP